MHQHPQAACAPAKPFLKWAGGKQRLLSTILKRLPAQGRLIEPFVGAGSVFLSGRYHQAVLNDANVDLVAVWTAIKERPAQFCRDASALFTAENHCASAYLRIRREFNECGDRYERAVRFIYLNRFGFNGVYRVNSRGEYNVPYGRPPSLPGFPWDQIEAASCRLERAIILGSDFRFVMELAKEGDVVYCDPPYLPMGETAFTAYTQRGFRVSDHEALVDVAKRAVDRGALVAISNHDTEQTRDLYAGFELHALTCARHVAGKVQSRKGVGEVLAVLGGPK